MSSAVIEVLVAEDNEDDLHLTLRALARYRSDLPLRTFGNGKEILDYLRARAGQSPEASSPMPGLILLDIKMPLVNGHEVLKAVRQERLCPGTPIVMFTSSREPQDIALAYENGANSFVVKPGWFEPYMETMRRLSSYWLDTNLTLTNSF